MLSSGSLAPVAKNRIKRELSLLATDPPPGTSCYAPNDCLTYLHATISGPPDSPFDNGIFLVSITIPNRYPFEPPKVRFQTMIHHPNIDAQGRICLDTLKQRPAGSWSPAVSLPSLLLSLRALMEKPNGDDGLVPETTAQFKNDYQGWFDQAKLLTEKEATDSNLLEKEDGIKLSILNATAREGREAVQPKSTRNPKIFARKMDKENRDKSVNVMEIDDDTNMDGYGPVSTGKRKGDEYDAAVENDRDAKVRRSD